MLSAVELYSNRRRAIITSFGLILAFVALICNMSFVRGIDHSTREVIEEAGGVNIVTIFSRDKNRRNVRDLYSRSNGLHVEDAEEILHRFPYITALLPKVELSDGAVSRGFKKSRGQILAVNFAHCDVFKYAIEKGRGLSRNDCNQKRLVCILGPRIVTDLFGSTVDPIGKLIFFSGLEFKVIGVIKDDDKYSEKSCQILFPYSVYTAYLDNKRGKIDELSVLVSESVFISQALIDMRYILLELHRGTEDFVFESNLTKLRQIQANDRSMKILLYFVAFASLLIAGISIANILFATIGDRVREIGIRKSIGAHPGQIFLQFTIESITLCFIGGVCGIVAGILITCTLKNSFPFELIVTPLDFLTGIAFVFITGIASGISPAIAASRMDIASALRS